MSRTLKFRKRRINTSQEGVTNMGEESDKVTHSYQPLLSTGLTTCKNVLYENFKGAEDWLNNTVSQGNQTRLKSTNTIYVSSLGERSVSQRLVISQAFLKLSENSVFALLMCKFKTKFSKKENYSTHSAERRDSGKAFQPLVLEKKQNSQPLKDEKVEKVSSVPPKSNAVEKQENSNKNKKNKDKEQNSGKVSFSLEKDSKTGSPKSSKSTNSKNKENKKK